MRRPAEVALALITLVVVPLTVGLVARSETGPAGAPAHLRAVAPPGAPVKSRVSALATAAPFLRATNRAARHCEWNAGRSVIRCTLMKRGSCEIEPRRQTATCSWPGNKSVTYLLLVGSDSR